MLPALFIPSFEEGHLDHNLLLGSMRFRQHRVKTRKKSNCHVPELLNDYVQYCPVAFNSKTEDENSYGPSNR